jgi:hypothetical protein
MVVILSLSSLKIIKQISTKHRITHIFKINDNYLIALGNWTLVFHVISLNEEKIIQSFDLGAGYPWGFGYVEMPRGKDQKYPCEIALSYLLKD